MSAATEIMNPEQELPSELQRLLVSEIDADNEFMDFEPLNVGAK